MKALEKQQKRTGVKLAPLQNRPKLEPGDEDFFLAFQRLSDSRENTMGGPAHVRISELLAYCELMGIASTEERSKYLRLVQKLDAAYLAEWHRRNPPKK